MRFSKWHALGNDYLLVERAEWGAALGAATVRKLCDYHVGVGSDGVLEVVRAEAAAAEIVVWNPDGSTAELSGNGTRIVARWLARRSGLREVTIRVGARAVTARVREGTDVTQELGAAVVCPPESLPVAGLALEVTPVSIGNPHAVIRRAPDSEELRRIGPLLERHPRFPERTNVQLVRVDGPHAVTVAVWERGAGETRSSGTSACAVAAAAIARGWCASPIAVHLPGGRLDVEVDERWHVRLTGPAEEICRGEVAEEFDLGFDG